MQGSDGLVGCNMNKNPSGGGTMLAGEVTTITGLSITGFLVCKVYSYSLESDKKQMTSSTKRRLTPDCINTSLFTRIFPDPILVTVTAGTLLLTSGAYIVLKHERMTWCLAHVRKSV